MTKLLLISDCGVPTGFGRIADEIAMRLHKRNIQVTALSYAYDGLLAARGPAGQPLPYHVGTLQGKPEPPYQPSTIMNVINVVRPDVIMSVQDAPYGETIRNLPLDWSQRRFIMLTPVDGVPIHPRWVETMQRADAAMTISQFGVEAFRKAGVQVELCRPGIDTDVFYPLPDHERVQLRQKLGLSRRHFIVGTMCQNQGRKSIPLMMRAFFEFAQDKPDARYLMDMHMSSPAGFDIKTLCQQHGWDESKIISRDDAIRAGVVELRDRYNMLDVHMVIAHREGYGLPLSEAMACGVPSMALEYCSGPETVHERGYLVPTMDLRVPGTWGGAEDQFPDMAQFVQQLQRAYDDPTERQLFSERGLSWARAQTWDKATNVVYDAIQRVMTTPASQPVPVKPDMTLPVQTPPSTNGRKPTQPLQLSENEVS